MESFTRKMGMVKRIDKKYLSETRKTIAQPILLQICLGNKLDPAQFQCIRELGLAEVQVSISSDAKNGQ